MKTLRRLMVPLSLLVMFFGLAVTRTKAQTLRETHFAGTFTLPFVLQWGDMIMPPGDYNMYYGTLNTSGLQVVEVENDSMWIQHGMVIAKGQVNRKPTQNVLVCVVEGNRAYVRSIEIADMNLSVRFRRPHFVEVESWIVSNRSHNSNAQLAVVRIPVAPVK